MVGSCAGGSCVGGSCAGGSCVDSGIVEILGTFLADSCFPPSIQNDVLFFS